MNPFELSGPEFLLFYSVLVGVVLFLLRRRRSSPLGPETLSDPYELAFLREGSGEVIRVGLLSLLDRRLLKATGGALIATGSPDAVRRPLERSILNRFGSEGPSGAAYEDAQVVAAVGAIQKGLRERALLHDEAALAGQGRARLVAVGVLLAVALVRLGLALSEGEDRVLYLLIFAIIAANIVWAVGSPSAISARGAASLARARNHFARLRQRAGDLVPGGETNELALLMAIFGFSSLPPLARDLLIEAHVARAPSGAGSACGSSCGTLIGDSSSGSDGGGSSCSSGCGGCGGGGCS